MPERSFFIKGFQFPVCARCTGVIIGELISLMLILFGCKLSTFFSLLLLMPMGIDWGIQYLKICMSNNLRRLITGVLGGFALTYIYYNIFLIIYKTIKELIT